MSSATGFIPSASTARHSRGDDEHVAGQPIGLVSLHLDHGLITQDGLPAGVGRVRLSQPRAVDKPRTATEIGEDQIEMDEGGIGQRNPDTLGPALPQKPRQVDGTAAIAAWLEPDEPSPVVASKNVATVKAMGRRKVGGGTAVLGEPAGDDRRLARASGPIVEQHEHLAAGEHHRHITRVGHGRCPGLWGRTSILVPVFSMAGTFAPTGASRSAGRAPRAKPSREGLSRKCGSR
jgi:hypothetical protein